MIKVFTGPMFASKSYELIKEYLKKYDKEKDNIVCFKPSKDKRDKSFIKSRRLSTKVPAFIISDLSEIKNYLTPQTTTIMIDEAQFLTGDVSELVMLTIRDHIDIYIAGLNLASWSTPFGVMPDILSIASEIVILRAECRDCGRDAEYTYCIVPKEGEVLIGVDKYNPLCGDCLYMRIGAL